MRASAMKSCIQFAALFILCLPAQAQLGLGPHRARAWTNKGVKAFKAGKYPEAEDDFKRAIKLDSKFKIAVLYLGTTYSYEVVPDLDTPENLKTADLAIAIFNQVLTSDPTDITSLKLIASIYRNSGRMEQAKEYEKQVIAAAPNEAEGHYILGLIDWNLAYRNAVARLKTDGLTDDAVGNLSKSAQACSDLVAANQSLVDEGIKELTRATELQADYSDAMTYLYLMYRRRADLYCEHPDDRRPDIVTADDWMQRAMQARKKNSTGEQIAPTEQKSPQ